MRMRGHRCSKISQWEKVAKCNFKSKAQVHEKCFFLMKWTVFCNAEDRFSWLWAFLMKKSFWSLNAQNHFFRASKNTNSVFSATKQIMRMRGPQMLKKFSQWEKVAKCNFKSKAQVHEKCFFLMKWTVFCNAEDRFHEQIMRMRGPQTLKNFLSEKKLLNAILEQSSSTWKMFSNEITVFCNAEDRFSWVWAFLQKKSF